MQLKGWKCKASGLRRGTLIYLHGVGDNRASSTGIIERFVPQGFDVLVYDSRAHGESQGRLCTYGHWEKQDLRRVIDTAGPGPVVLLGSSLGAAVALLTVAEDKKVSAVIAAETFSDLRTVAVERAPFFFSAGMIDRAIALAEEQANFQAASVSPANAAARITVPVLLIHGASDTATSPDHSRRVYQALKGPKRLLIVPGAGHSHSLRPEVWIQIEKWIRESVGH